MKNNKQTGVKKILRIIGIALLSIVVIIAVTMSGIFMAHRLSLRSEAKRIVDYGQKVPVFDGELNVLDEGAGDQTIVLLTGYGTAAPGLDFKTLIKELAKDYRVVMIEPFGYGLSSGTERERSAANMVEEIHEVTKQLGLEKYVLMGHSIAGIYGLNYVNTYPTEVTAFVGIDSSVPNQPWPGFRDGLSNFLQQSGILRLMVKLNPEGFRVEGMDDETYEQARLLTMRNMSNKVMRKEGKSLDDAFETSKKLAFPADLPLLLFIAEKHDLTVEGWAELHHEQIANSIKGEVIELPGTHYLHHTASKEIAEDTKQFLSEE